MLGDFARHLHWHAGASVTEKYFEIDLFTIQFTLAGKIIPKNCRPNHDFPNKRILQYIWQGV
jgi:hypothetical protein